MKVNVFDVSHGFCALLTSTNDARILFDCGHKHDEFYPSSYLRAVGCTQLAGLVIQNFDQDHVSDIISVWNQAPPLVWYSNTSVPGNVLTTMKTSSGFVTGAMGKVISEINQRKPVTYWPDLGGIELYTFFHDYPLFTDENNLSVVTFVSYGSFRMIFTGDLERSGWEVMLKNSYFQQMLRGVTIFVASHHGRENGFCREVFDYCSPELVVISDKEIVHSTQLVKYSEVVPFGIPFGDIRRKTITTRNDGHISIDVSADGSYWVNLGQLG